MYVEVFKVSVSLKSLFIFLFSFWEKVEKYLWGCVRVVVKVVVRGESCLCTQFGLARLVQQKEKCR